MGWKETNVLNECRMAASHLAACLFRNNRGLFLTLDGKRKVRAGMEPNGSSDGIGWASMQITPEMVGRTVAVFMAVETKQGEGRLSKEQKEFLDGVNRCGGIGCVAYGPDDVTKAIEGFKNGKADI